MNKKLTPVEWAELLGRNVYHKLFKECKLIGIRIESYENNNLMLLVIGDDNAHFWVYDYETTPLK